MASTTIGVAVAVMGVLIGWSSFSAAAGQQDREARTSPPSAIPEIMPIRGTWVDEISNSVRMQKEKYPSSDFGPYLKRLDRVDAALTRGEQQTVRTEMTTFFQMLAKHKGINEDAATELSNFAQMVAPLQEYGIPVPRSAADSYGSTVIQ